MKSELVPENIERLVPYRPGKPLEELERELGVKNAIKLASNENPLGPSPIAVAAIKEAAESAHRYPDAGAYALRRAVAEHHGVGMDEIVPGCGSNELIDLICRTYAGPSDHAVIGAPSFVCYHLGLTTANVPYTSIPLRDQLFWDAEAMAAAVRPETKLLFLANPNNPTGTYLPEDKLRWLLSSLPERVVVVLDEAYFDFADAEDYRSALELRELRERLLVLRTFSKAFGLAALRVGYAIGRPEVVSYLHRTRPPFNVNQLAQAGAIAALGDLPHVERYIALNRSERERVSRGLRELGLEVAPSQTNFVLADFGRPGGDVYEPLLREGVIVRPMPPPIERWIRITIGTAQENDRLLGSVAGLLRGQLRGQPARHPGGEPR